MRPHGLVASDASLDCRPASTMFRARRRATDTRRSRPPRPPAGDSTPRPPRRTRAAALLNGRRERLGGSRIPLPSVLEHLDLRRRLRPVLLEEDVVVLAAVEGRIEVDEIDGLVLDVLAKDGEVIPVVELVHPSGNFSWSWPAKSISNAAPERTFTLLAAVMMRRVRGLRSSQRASVCGSSSRRVSYRGACDDRSGHVGGVGCRHTNRANGKSSDQDTRGAHH